MRTVAILPVKGSPRAKQRLADTLVPQLRQELAEAMLRDVLAALALTAVDAILVVTASERAAEIAEAHGATVLRDDERGHNAAAELGIAAALELKAARVLLVPGDCPALVPGEVDELLRRPLAEPGAIIVPDRHGTGTNALLLTPPDALSPSFGPGSCRRHAELARTRGIQACVVEVAGLALDVDTAQDLEALLAGTGTAPHTHAVMSRC